MWIKSTNAGNEIDKTDNESDKINFYNLLSSSARAARAASYGYYHEIFEYRLNLSFCNNGKWPLTPARQPV